MHGRLYTINYCRYSSFKILVKIGKFLEILAIFLKSFQLNSDQHKDFVHLYLDQYINCLPVIYSRLYPFHWLWVRLLQLWGLWYWQPFCRICRWDFNLLFSVHHNLYLYIQAVSHTNKGILENKGACINNSHLYNSSIAVISNAMLKCQL